jgi:hypothetical protein
VSVNSNALSEQWAAFVDLVDDVKPYLQIPLSDTTRDITLKLVVDGVCEWVQREVGKPIGATEFKRKFDGNTGWNGTYIMLPYVPVLEVISVDEWWGNSGDHTLTEQTPANQVDGWQCEYQTGRLTRVFQGQIPKPWFPGSGNVWVVWRAGYNPAPASARLAVLEAIKWWWDNTQQQSRGFNPNAAEYDAPDTQQFWGAVVPAMMQPIITQFASVGIG